MFGDTTIVVKVGDEYVDAGAISNDRFEGSIEVVVASNVDTTKVGVYKVLYTATDSSGNVSTLERTVAVVDTTPPVKEMLGNAEVESQFGEEYTDAGARAFDLYEGEIEVTVDNQVNIYEVGAYKVVYTASDSSGNVATAERTVTIVDTTAPVIEMLGDIEVVVKVGDEYVDAGAKAIDLYDGEIEVVVTSNVDTSKVGVYKVLYTATDSSGNVSTLERTVAVVDTTAPVIEMFGNAEVELQVGSEYVDARARAFDLYDGEIFVKVDNQVDTSKVG